MSRQIFLTAIMIITSGIIPDVFLLPWDPEEVPEGLQIRPYLPCLPKRHIIAGSNKSIAESHRSIAESTRKRLQLNRRSAGPFVCTLFCALDQKEVGRGRKSTAQKSRLARGWRV